ncbi:MULTISPECIES: signal peptidase [Chryseobacterium]|uniref:signal peptidase n=1 Tax=Chryseobacterium TaxID=59732 RepID=UPI001BE4E6A6|nr:MULTISPECIES: signal peptidase [Chryseobacterium]MBT2622169.1 signal peptidase [Chryseobacterium sp. ISL-6]
MKALNKLIYGLFLFAVFLVNAQGSSGPGGGQPPQPGDGGGSVGPGAAPIDMYVYALSIIAVLLIVFFTKKYKNQKI